MLFCVSHFPFLKSCTVCRNEVDVPEGLRHKLEASIHCAEMHAATHTEFLEEHTRERRASIQEDETVKFINELNKKLLVKVPNFSLRVKNGSYTITNYYDASKKDAKATDGRAKQKIATVKTESPVYKLSKLLCRCLKGNMKPQKKEVIVMDQVNLAFEPGKMYLVL